MEGGGLLSGVISIIRRSDHLSVLRDLFGDDAQPTARVPCFFFLLPCTCAVGR